MRDSVSALSEVLIVTHDPPMMPTDRRNRRESYYKPFVAIQHTCKHGNLKSHHHKRRKDQSNNNHHHHRRHHKPTCEFYEKSTISRKLLPASLPPELVILTHPSREKIRRPSMTRSMSVLQTIQFITIFANVFFLSIPFK